MCYQNQLVTDVNFTCSLCDDFQFHPLSEEFVEELKEMFKDSPQLYRDEEISGSKLVVRSEMMKKLLNGLEKLRVSARDVIKILMAVILLKEIKSENQTRVGQISELANILEVHAGKMEEFTTFEIIQVNKTRYL